MLETLQDMLVPIDGPIDSLEDLTPMEVTALREWYARISLRPTFSESD